VGWVFIGDFFPGCLFIFYILGVRGYALFGGNYLLNFLVTDGILLSNICFGK